MGGRGSGSAISRERMAADFEAIMRNRGGPAEQLAQPVFLALDRVLAENPNIGPYVRLSMIRPELARMGFTSRESQDRAILAFSSVPHGYITPIHNQSALSSADRSAAITLGGKANHAIRRV